MKKRARESSLTAVPVKVADAPNGFYIGATIVDNVEDKMTIAREEVFGPVLNVMRMGDLDAAIEIGKKSDRQYGNGAAIFTNSGKAAPRIQTPCESRHGRNQYRRVPATMAMFPFTGFGTNPLLRRPSHPVGKEGVQFYTQQKVVTSRWFGDNVGDVWRSSK